jgi:OHCU decarboxylase
MKIKLNELNRCSPAQFVAVCGPLFEHSSWIAERTAAVRPFASRQALHVALCQAVDDTTSDEQLELVRAHPDLVGRAVRGRNLTDASAAEQASAGLPELSADDARRLADFNAAYRSKFGFPFVICARDNKKEAILAAFPQRLANTADQELRTALGEVAKIAWYRLCDAIEEG